MGNFWISNVGDLSTLAITFATHFLDIVANFAEAHRKVCGPLVGQIISISSAGITRLEECDYPTLLELGFLYFSPFLDFHSISAYNTINLLNIGEEDCVV